MRLTTKFLVLIITSVLGVAVGSSSVFGASSSVVVVPNTLATVEGSGNNVIPFDLACCFVGAGPTRYQQVYSASQFSGAGLITQIAFRPDAFFAAPFSATLASVQINLSTTSKAVDGLDVTFANNVGSDDTIVHSGQLALSSSLTGPAGGPKAFDIVIPLQTPFSYDPGKGNLLLDVRNLSGESLAGATTIAFDAEVVSGDPISRLASNSVNDPTGGPDTAGLVTQFTMTAQQCHSQNHHDCRPH